MKKIIIWSFVFVFCYRISYGSNTPTLPSPYSTYTIESWFGPRIHPVDGFFDLHNGIDYNVKSGDADLGEPILAVEGGRICSMQTDGKIGKLGRP